MTIEMLYFMMGAGMCAVAGSMAYSKLELKEFLAIVALISVGQVLISLGLAYS